MMTNSCLKLDVYTQTDSSFVADNYTKSLVRHHLAVFLR